MNTANKITMIRVVLVPIFMVLFMIDNVMCHYAVSYTHLTLPTILRV